MVLPVAVPGSAPRGRHAAGRPRTGIGRTRAGLVAGAARAFAEQGIRGCTMQAVAARAGVAKATLYNHFRTKDEIVRALCASELDRMSELAAARPPAEALAALADELGEHPVLRRLAAGEPDVLAGLLDVSPEAWAALTGRLGAALGAEEDDAEVIARWLIGVIVRPGRSSSRHRAAARLAATLGDA